MRKKQLLLVLFGLVVLTISTTQVAAITNVAACGTLSTANEIYNLTQNVTATGSCIVFGATNQTFLGNGYTVGWGSSSTGQGLSIYADTNITVRDVVLQYKGASAQTAASYRDVYVGHTSTKDILLDNITIIPGAQTHDYGIYAEQGSNIVVTNTVINTGRSIALRVADSADGVLFENITATCTVSPCIYITGTDDSTFKNIVASGNQNALYITSTSTGNTFTGGIYNATSSQHGLIILASTNDNNVFENVIFDSATNPGTGIRNGNVNFTNVSFLSSSVNAIYISEAANNIMFRNSRFGGTNNGLNIEGTSGNIHNISVINSQFLSSNILLDRTSTHKVSDVFLRNSSPAGETFSVATDDLSYEKQWQLDFNLFNYARGGLKAALVEIFDKDLNLVFSKTAGNAGDVNGANVTEFLSQGSSGKTYYTNYTINLSRTTYDSRSLQRNITQNQVFNEPLAQTGLQTLIEGCGTTVDTPGLNFLAGDFTSGEDCLIINTSNVELDLFGTTMTGNSRADTNGAGVAIELSNAENVSIYGGSIIDFSKSIRAPVGSRNLSVNNVSFKTYLLGGVVSFAMAIDSSDSDHRYTNLDIRDMYAGGSFGFSFGLAVGTGGNVLVENVTIDNVTSGYSDGPSGFFLANVSGLLIRNTTISNMRIALKDSGGAEYIRHVLIEDSNIHNITNDVVLGQGKFSNFTIKNSIVSDVTSDLYYFSTPSFGSVIADNLTLSNIGGLHYNGPAKNLTIRDTNFANYSFSGAGANVTYEDTTNGRLRFLEPLTGSGNSFSAQVQLTNNYAFVNDSNSGLNKPADVKFTNVVHGLTNPVLLRNGVECTGATSPSCYALSSLAGPTIQFNVSGWSNYTIGEGGADLSVQIQQPTNSTFTTATPDLKYTVLPLANASQCWYTLNGGVTNTSLPSCTNTTLSTLTDGQYTLTVYVNDSVSNVNSSSVSFSIETVHPTISFVNPTPANGSNRNKNSIFVNVSAADASSPIYTFVNKDNSLLAWYMFDNATTSTNGVYDHSGNGRFGNITSYASITPQSKYGNGLYSDGDVTNRPYAEIGKFMEGSTFGTNQNTQFTVSVWNRFEGINTAGDFIFDFNGALNQGFALKELSGTVRLDYGTGSSLETINFGIGNRESLVDEWHHYAATYNGTHILVFFNGALQASAEALILDLNKPSSRNAQIGCRAISTYLCLNGTVDDFLIFNRNFNTSEIASLYNATANQYENNFTGLSDATYNFTAYAVDRHGNINQTENRQIAIDTVLPNIGFTNPTPANGSTVLVNSIYTNVSSSDASKHYIATSFDRDIILWLRMDDVDASGNPTDLSGYGTNTTLNTDAAITSSGKFGNAVRIGETTGYLDLTPSGALTTAERTVSAWIYRQPTSTGTWTPLYTSADDSYVGWTQTGSTFRALWFNSSGAEINQLVGSYSFPNNKWMHVAFVWDTGDDDPLQMNLSVYLDGNLHQTIARTDGLQTRNFIDRIGKRTNDNYLNGSIDEFIVFNRPLEANEILSLYNATVNQYQKNFTSLSDGTYTLTSYAVDAAGNINQTEDRDIIVSSYTICDGPLANTDWTISASDNCVISNQVLSLSQDYNISIAGNLTLINTTLNMNATGQGTSQLVVSSGGYFNITGGTLINETNSGSSSLQFNSGSEAYIQNVILEGYSSIDTYGLKLFDNVVARNVNAIDTQSNQRYTNVELDTLVLGGLNTMFRVFSRNNVTFENITVSNINTQSSFQLRSIVTNLTMTNIYINAAGGRGFMIRDLDSDSVVINNITCTNTGDCFEMLTDWKGGNMKVYNSTLQQTEGTNVDFSLENANFTLINTTYNQSRLTNFNPLSFVDIKWYTIFNITDASNNSAIQGATIQLYNSTNVLQDTLTSSVAGFAKTEVTEKIIGQSVVQHFTNYTFNVSKAGYETTSVTRNFSQSQQFNLQLSLTPTNLAIAIQQPTNTTYITSTPTFNYTVLPASSADQCWYSLNGGVTNTTLPGCTNITLPSLTDGQYTLTAYVNNSVNFRNSSSISFSVHANACSGPLAGYNWTVTVNDDCTFTNQNLQLSQDNNVFLYGNLTLINTTLDFNGSGSLSSIFTTYSGSVFNMTSNSVLNNSNAQFTDINFNSGSEVHLTGSFIERYLGMETHGLRTFDNMVAKNTNYMWLRNGVKITNSRFSDLVLGGYNLYAYAWDNDHITIENVTLEGTQQRVIGLRGNAENITFNNVTITGSGSFGGIRFTSHSGDATFNGFNCSIDSTRNCLELSTDSSSQKVLFYNSTFSSILDFDNFGTNWRFINTSLNRSMFTAAAAASFASVDWYTTFNITDAANNSAISGATIQVYNSTNGLITTLTTAASGITKSNLTEYEIAGLQTNWQTNYTFNVSKVGYNTESFSRNFSQSQQFNLPLTLTPTDLAIAIQQPTNTTILDNTPNLNYTVNALANADRCWYSLNGGITNTTLPSCTNTTLPAQTNGPHTVFVYANISTGSVFSANVSFETYIPIFSVNVTEPANITYAINNIDLKYEFFNHTKQDQCWYSLNAGVTNTTLAGCGQGTLSSLSDGQHTVVVYTNDTFNNVNQSSVSFSVDATPPSISFVNPTPANGSTVTINSIYTNVSSSDSNNHYVFADFNRDVLAYWSFDSTSGTIVEDSSTYENNATLVGNPTINVNGQFGSALQSTANDSKYASLPIGQYLNVTNRITSFSFWANANETVSQDGFFATSGVSTSNPNFAIGHSSNLLRVRIQNTTSGEEQNLGAVDITNTGWHHIVVIVNDTFSQTRVSAYIDNSFIETDTFTVNGNKYSAVTGRIGRTVNWGAVNGSIDEFIIFNRSLTTQEIGALYNASVNQYRRNYTGLAIGEYNITAYAVDRFGNVNQTMLRTITVEQLTIAIAIQQPTNATILDNTPNLNYTVNALTNADQCWYSLNGGATNTTLPSCTNTTLPAQTNGPHTIFVYANTSAGAVFSANVSFETYIPIFSVGITSPTNTTYPSTSVNLNYTLYNHTKQDQCWYSLNGGTTNTSLASCADNTISGLFDGPHTVTVYTNDTYNNVNQSSISFTTNTSIFVTLDQPTNTTYFANSVNLNFTTLSVPTVDSCWYSLNNGVTNTSLPGCANTTLTGLSYGPHTVIVYANNTVGNLDSASVSFETYIPIFSVSIESPTNTTYPLAFVDLNYTLYNHTKQDQCWYSLNGGTTNTSLASCADNTISGLADGAHTVTVYTNDTFNNVNQSTVSFTTDTSITLNLQNPLNQTYLVDNVAVNFTTQSFGSVDQCWYSFNGGTTNTTIASCNNFSLSSQANGQYNLQVFANNTAGTVGTDSISYEIYVWDFSVSIQSPTNTTYGTSTVDLNYTVHRHTKQDQCWYSLNGGTTNSSLASCANTTLSGLSNGAHTVIVYTNDTYNNVNQSSISFTTDTSMTVAIQQPTNTTYFSTSVALNYTTLSVSSVDSCWYSLDGGVTNTSLASCVNTTLTGLSETSYNLIVYANNSVGTVGSDTQSFTVYVPSFSLTIQSPTNTTYDNNTVDLNYTLYDHPRLDACWYTINGGVTNTSLASCANTTLSSFSDGNYAVTVFTNDTFSNINQTTAYFSINTSAPSIRSATPTNTTVTIAEYLSQVFAVNYSNPADNVVATWYVNGSQKQQTGPNGNEYSSWTWNGNFSAQGMYNVTVILSNVNGNVSREWTLIATDVTAGTLSLTGLASTQTVASSGSFTYTVNASCSGSTCANVTLWIDPLPADLDASAGSEIYYLLLLLTTSTIAISVVRIRKRKEGQGAFEYIIITSAVLIITGIAATTLVSIGDLTGDAGKRSMDAKLASQSVGVTGYVIDVNQIVMTLKNNEQVPIRVSTVTVENTTLSSDQLPRVLQPGESFELVSYSVQGSEAGATYDLSAGVEFVLLDNGAISELPSGLRLQGTVGALETYVKGTLTTDTNSEPFYIDDSLNYHSCGDMSNGATCQKTFTVVATGGIGSYEFFGYARLSGVYDEETEKIYIGITG